MSSGEFSVTELNIPPPLPDCDPPKDELAGPSPRSKGNPRWRLSLVIQGGGFPLSFVEEIKDDSSLQISTEADGVRRIQAGTKSSLIEMLFAEKTLVDVNLQEFIDIFLITHPIFIPSLDLLSILLERYRKELRSSNLSVIDRINQVLKQWATRFDLLHSDQLMELVEAWLNEPTTLPEHQAPIRVAIKMYRIEKRKTVRIFPPISADAMDLDILNENPVHFAQQLSALDNHLFCILPLSEFHNQNWVKRPHLTPHLKEIVERFNYVSYWLQSKIVAEVSVKKRAKVLSRVLAIGQEMLTHRNYNGAMMIYSTVGTSGIKRLSHTIEALSDQDKVILKRLEETYNPSNNFANYRRVLAKTTPPCIPFIGLIMTDLTFMDENADMVEGSDSMINFKKFLLIGKSLLLAQTYQKNRYEFEYIPYLLSFFKGRSAALTEKQIYARSLEIEPRGVTSGELKKLQKRLETVDKDTLRSNKKSAKESSEERKKRVMDRSKRRTISTAIRLEDIDVWGEEADEAPPHHQNGVKPSSASALGVSNANVAMLGRNGASSSYADLSPPPALQIPPSLVIPHNRSTGSMPP